MDQGKIGKFIAVCRREKGFTQEQLAELIDVSTSFIGHIERGTRVLSVDTLERLCRTLHITPNMLLSFSSVFVFNTVFHKNQAFWISDQKRTSPS